MNYKKDSSNIKNIRNIKNRKSTAEARKKARDARNLRSTRSSLSDANMEIIEQRKRGTIYTSPRPRPRPVNMDKANKYIKKHEANVYRKKQNSHVSLSFVLSLLIFLYIIGIIFVNVTRKKYDFTVAELGVLSNSQTFKGLIVRDETVYKADKSGSVKYFALEGERVRSGMDLAGIVDDEQTIRLLERKISAATGDLSIDAKVKKDVLKNIKNSLRSFTINNNFKNVQFTANYNNDLKQEVAFIRDKYLLKNSDYASEYLRLKKDYDNKINFIKADKSGVISYNIDEKEDLDIDKMDYTYVDNLSNNITSQYKKKVAQGDTVCKVINDHFWYVVFEIDAVCKRELNKKRLDENNYFEVYLGEEKQFIYGKIYKEEIVNGKTYLTLRFDRFLNNFLNRRTVPVQILYRNYTGIKIPETAVVKKKFVKIPKEFFCKDGQVKGVYKYRKKSEENDESTKPKIQQINIIKDEGDFIWIPVNNEITVGAKIYTFPEEGEEEDSKEFVIDEERYFDGVYVANKGFTMFKFIEIDYEENGFLIVKADIPYGVRTYDRIMSDSSSVEENVIINR